MKIVLQKRMGKAGSGVFIVNFEHISHLVLVFLLVTLNMQLPAGLSLKKRDERNHTTDANSESSKKSKMELFAKSFILHVSVSSEYISVQCTNTLEKYSPDSKFK